VSRFDGAVLGMRKQYPVMDSELYRKALSLSYFTVGYNIVEGVASIFAGLLAGSIALVGFGLDSFLESLSGIVMIWRFRQHGRISKVKEEKIERKATRLVAYTFFSLAAYVFYESSKRLYFHEIPHPSILGIIIATVSTAVMPILFHMKYQTGKSINSRSLIADSKETLACTFLSVALLVGLGINYLSGFWQADPIVGLVIVIFLVREGYTILKEEELSHS
jgi:divalent metal cation (Fe/Co/Zn/Cd) transporter